MTLLGRCWSCTNGIDANTDKICEKCGGSGMVPVTRSEAWTRRKEYLGLSHPDADANGNEKWVRYCVEIPPELAALIDAEHRKALGVNASSASRAGATRHGLRLLLEHYAPEEPRHVEGSADELPPEPSQLDQSDHEEGGET